METMDAEPVPAPAVEAEQPEAATTAPEAQPDVAAGAEGDAATLPVLTESSVADAMAAAIAKAREAAAAAASEPDASTQAAAPEVTNGAEREGRPRKKRFGPAANVLAPAPKPRKRKSRWETEDSSSTTLALASKPLWPTDVVLPGGITVRYSCLPATCSSDGCRVCMTSLRLRCPSLAVDRQHGELLRIVTQELQQRQVLSPGHSPNLPPKASSCLTSAWFMDPPDPCDMACRGQA